MLKKETLLAMLNSSIKIFHESDINNVVGVSSSDVENAAKLIQEKCKPAISIEDLREFGIFEMVMGVKSCYSAFIKENECSEKMNVSEIDWRELKASLHW